MRSEFSYSQEGRFVHGHIERVMGTRFDMVIPDIAESAARMIWDEMCSWLEHSDALLDRFNADSEVARLNAGQLDSTSEHLSEWIEMGEGYSARTLGLFSVKTGGQLDFVMGAYLSKGGKSFICMPSTFTNKDGSLASRIKPSHIPCTIMTDPRTCPVYIVTEYGMVNLKGLSTWQRAEQLINIAHPDFRDELIKAAEAQHIWRRSNK